MHVLFVCTGNICRSPLAERLAIAYSGHKDAAHFHASSAGTRAMISYPMHPEAAVVLQHLGGDPSDFSARQLTPRIANEADLILTMTKEHRNHVLELAPTKLRKTYTIAEAAELVRRYQPVSVADLAALRPQLAGTEVPDVPDPIGQNSKVFESIGAQIADLLQPIVGLVCT